jgi:hypothetical protein
MNRWIILAIVFGVILWLLSSALGTAMFSFTTILWGLLVLVILQKLGILRTIPLPKRSVTILGVVVAGIMFFTGAFSVVLTMLPTMPTAAPTAATITSPTTTETTSTAVSNCIEKVKAVNPNLVGKAATVTINAYDMASNTPYSSAVDTTAYIVSDGQVVKTTDTSSYSMSGYSVGDVISVYGGSSSYYLADKKDVCIDKEQFPLELDAYAVVAQSDLQITGYDDTGATTLSAGTTPGEEDYDITIGADGEESFYLKIKVNVANKAFNLYGVATTVANDIDECEPQDTVFTEVPAPRWLKGLSVANETSEENLTGVNFDTWVLPEPILLTEWESKKYQFNFKASSTDPTTNSDFGSSDMCIVCFFDAVWDRGDDGKLYLDFYTHDSSESDVGMAGLPTLPVGKQDCVVTEGI